MTQTAARARPQPDAACVHHWRLEPNDKPVSCGRCKLCGAERDFANGLTWDGADAYGHAWRHYPQALTPALLAAMRFEASVEYAVPFGELRA